MHTRNSGFSLIEMLITMAIVAIVAAFAYPSYVRQVLRANRSDGQVALNVAAQTMERCHTTAGTYVGCIATLPYTTTKGLYQIRAMGGVAANIKAHEFALDAVPQGSQAKDDDCASLTMDQAGKATAKNKGGTDNSVSCWK